MEVTVLPHTKVEVHLQKGAKAHQREHRLERLLCIELQVNACEGSL